MSTLSPHTTVEFEGFANFVVHAAKYLSTRQLVDGVASNVNFVFEIGNEPNGGFMNVCKTSEEDHLANAEVYKLIARTVGQKMRNANHPNAEVMRRVRSAPLFLAGLAAGAWQWKEGGYLRAQDFLERILAFRFNQGGGNLNLEDLYDGVTFHPYDTYSDGPENPSGTKVGAVDIVNKIAAVVDSSEYTSRTSPEKRMALGVTEYGYQVRPECVLAPEDGGNQVACLTHDYERAKYLQRGLSLLLSLRRVAFVNVFTWRRPDTEIGFGVVGNASPHAPTHAYRGLKDYMAQMSGLNIGKRQELGKPSLFVFPLLDWDNTGGPASVGYVAWNAFESEAQIDLPLSVSPGTEYCIYQYDQKPVTGVTSSSSLSVRVGSVPRFLKLGKNFCTDK